MTQRDILQGNCGSKSSHKVSSVGLTLIQYIAAVLQSQVHGFATET